MANNSLETAFNVPVTPDEARLLEECFTVAAEISSGFYVLPQDEPEAPKSYYDTRSDAFKAAFPKRDDHDDPFVTFCGIFPDLEYIDFDADLSIEDDPDGEGRIAFIRGDQADVSALAALIQKVCKSALPFGFEWAACCDVFRPGQFGGGYYVISDAEILGGSTHRLMQETLRSVRTGA